MTTDRNFRATFRSTATVALLALGLSTTPAHAVNKDMVQLQTQVQELQDAVARLTQANDERMGVLKDLVQQTADSVNKMGITVNGLQLKLQNVQDAESAKHDQLSGQVQSLNDSIDELKARLGRMEKALGDIQGQQAAANSILQSLPQAVPSPAGGGAPLPTNPPQGGLSGPAPTASQAANDPNAAPQNPGLPAGDMYRTAYGDYVTAKYGLATTEFESLIQAYPSDNLSGNAYFYLGEMNLRSNKPSSAIKAYSQVIDNYPDNSKLPAARLHRAEAMIATKQTDNAQRELRALIQRYPNSPEAMQARAKLAAIR
jgi:tol-pal system protein YbgF